MRGATGSSEVGGGDNCVTRSVSWGIQVSTRVYDTLHTSSMAREIFSSLLERDKITVPSSFSTVSDGLSFTQLAKLPTASGEAARAIVLTYLFSAGYVGWPPRLSVLGVRCHPMDSRLRLAGL